MFTQTQAREAVAALLDHYTEQRRAYDRIHLYMTEWDAKTAAAKIGVSASTKNRAQHEELARMSVSPFISLVIDNYSQSLRVDGFYSTNHDVTDVWRWWQRNKMAKQQHALHRDALTYGVSYAAALPASDGVNIKVLSPRRVSAFYPDHWLSTGGVAAADEYPIIAAHVGQRHIRLFDEEHVYVFGVEHQPPTVSGWSDAWYVGHGNLPLLEIREHGVGVTPLVRYEDRGYSEGEERRGIVEHLIGLQDRINRTNYEQGVAQHFAAFKQRYVIGWMPKDEREAFKQSVADTQFFEDPDVKVGQYAETDLDGYISSRQATVRDFAALAQVPAQSLGANAISNISADGLAALETSKDRQTREIQTSLSESYEQLLRLCSAITGDEAGADDFDAEIQWAETSARSFAQTVDGLGKLAAMLGIPPEELWADIPGWTRERVERAVKARDASWAGPAGVAGGEDAWGHVSV